MITNITTQQEELVKLAIELSANKHITLTDLNGTSVWGSTNRPTPEMIIAAVGTPPGGYWKVTTVEPSGSLTRDGQNHPNALITAQISINWVDTPAIPAQPYVPSLPAAVIAAQTASNTDVVLQEQNGYNIVSTEVTRQTVSFEATKAISHAVTSVPYMRQKLVEFIVEGLRPLARHYISFDTTRIDSHATSINSPYTFGNALIADSSGRLAGIIRIPPNTFLCGEHVITLTDVNNPDTDIETSSAQAVYVARGFLDTSTNVYSVTKKLTSRAAIQQTYVAIPKKIKFSGG